MATKSMEDKIWSTLRAGVYPENHHCQEIEHLSSKLAKKVQAAADSLRTREERQHLEKLSEACRNILSPIRKAPQDVLRYIFLLALDSMSVTDYRSGLPVQVVLSHICCSWRHVALQSPELWTNLNSKIWSRLDMAKSWLTRGSGCNLNVEYIDLLPNQIFDINTIINRVREYHLTLSFSGDRSETLLSSTTFGSLEELNIRFLYTGKAKPFEDGWPEGDPLRALGYAPHLQRLTIEIECIDFKRSFEEARTFFPWAQLTYLHLEKIDVKLFPPLLSCCSSLQEAYFRVSGLHHQFHEPTIAFPETTLPYLNELSIIVEEGKTFDPILLERIRSPYLTSLMLEEWDEVSYLSYPDEPRRWIQPGHFLSQLHNLQSLTFMHPPHDLVLLLSNTPELRSLTLMTHWNVDHVLRAMTLHFNQTRPNILPNLTTFRLQIFDKLRASADVIVRMAMSRREGRVPDSFRPLEVFNIQALKTQSCLLTDLRRKLKQELTNYPHWTISESYSCYYDSD